MTALTMWSEGGGGVPGVDHASSEVYSLAYLAMFCGAGGGAKALRRRLPRWVAWSSGVGFWGFHFTFLLTAYPFVDVVDAKGYAAKILGTTLVANGVGYGFYRGRRVGVMFSLLGEVKSIRVFIVRSFQIAAMHNDSCMRCVRISRASTRARQSWYGEKQ